MIVGDVNFEMRSGSTDVAWKDVFFPKKKAKIVRDFMEAAEQDKKERDEKLQRLQGLRQNVTYSDNLLIMPLLGAVFYDHFWGRKYNLREVPDIKVHYGKWVDAGDMLCNYHLIKPGFGGSVHLPIFSPVSGRVLNISTHSWGIDDSGSSKGNDSFSTHLEHPFFVIQLPKGEAIPTSTEPSYGRFSEILFKNRGGLLQSGSENPKLTDKDVRALVEQFRTQTFPVKPIGVGHYKALADELDEKYGGLIIEL